MTTADPVLSVVVPTYNREARLRRVIAALSDQTLEEPYEIVVVSDGSTDGTDDYLREEVAAGRIEAIMQPNQGPATARNRGVEQSRGEVVVFVDDDVVADRCLLQAHLDEHRTDPRLVTIGPMVAPTDQSCSPWIQWEHEMLDRQYQAMNNGSWSATARQFYTGNAAIRRKYLTEVGGFDPDLRRAEDIELAYRLDDLDLTFRFCPDAVGYHYAERSFASWRRVAYAYGRNDVVFARDRGQDWIYDSIRTKLATYPRVAGAVVATTVTRPRLSNAVVKFAGRAAVGADRLGQRRAARTLLSAAYSLEYHRGVVDESGSTELIDPR